MSARKSVESDYYITPCGRIWSYRSNKFLKPGINSWGYPFVYYCGKLQLVHRLVAQKWIPNPENLPIVNHKDENPLNANVSNLEWCDAKYNNNYGKMKTREKSKVKVYCFETDTIYESVAECQRQLGISNISLVINGKCKQMNGYTFERR